MHTAIQTKLLLWSKSSKFLYSIFIIQLSVLVSAGRTFLFINNDCTYNHALQKLRLDFSVNQLHITIGWTGGINVSKYK